HVLQLFLCTSRIILSSVICHYIAIKNPHGAASNLQCHTADAIGNAAQQHVVSDAKAQSVTSPL
ncbi:MAG: hypothetical protein ACKO96_43975, partial [Flammeovirgaceae bacterium]